MQYVNKPLDVVIVGGGMITNDLILPSAYHRFPRSEFRGATDSNGADG